MIHISHHRTSYPFQAILSFSLKVQHHFGVATPSSTQPNQFCICSPVCETESAHRPPHTLKQNAHIHTFSPIFCSFSLFFPPGEFQMFVLSKFASFFPSAHTLPQIRSIKVWRLNFPAKFSVSRKTHTSVGDCKMQFFPFPKQKKNRQNKNSSRENRTQKEF